MKTIRYRIKAVNPLIISSKRGDANMVNTKSYIPGNSILGVFAYLYIKNEKLKDAHKNEKFYSWFLKDNLTFTNAYIVDDDHRYFPNPHSIKEEKYIDNSVYDLMFADDNFNKPTRFGEAFIDIENSTIYNKSIKRSISFHHARENGLSKKGTIFNYESISENQVFEGSIIGASEQLEKFKEIFPKKITVYIGLSKNSQYGKVEIELKNISDYKQEIETDIESYNSAIIMTLLSDVIIYNDNGFSTADVNGLEKLLGVKIKNSFIKKDRTEQFVGIWKLKNSSETVFTAGSCFKFNKLPDNYEEIQIKGIGEKTNEGFGRVIFGWQGRSFQYFKKSEIEIPDRPEGKSSEFVKDIITDIIKERLRDKAISKAMQDADSFSSTNGSKLPTKSLCGKLQSIAMNIDTFQIDFDLITGNKIAETQLKKCNNGKIRLLDYFKDFKDDERIVDINSLFNGIENLNEFTNLLKNNKNLSNELKKVYLKTFFNFMRKDERRENESRL